MKKAEWKEMSERYFRLLRPLQNPVAIKYCTDLAEFQTYGGLQTYNWTNPVCGAIGRCGYEEITLGVRDENFLSDYCRGINGFIERDARWHSGESHSQGWHDGITPAKAHHDALVCLPPIYKGVVVSALATGAIEEPDAICLQLSPSAAFLLLAGYIHRDYEVVDFTFIGESGCSDCWNRTIIQGKVGLSFGCRGERSYGQLNENELRISMTEKQFLRALDGVEGLSDKGVKFPFTGEALYSDIVNSPTYAARYGFFANF